MPMTTNTIQQDMFGILLGGERAPPLSMETGCVFRNFGKGVGELVEKSIDWLGMKTFYGDARPAEEGHGPVGVETSRWVYGYWQRINVITQTMPVGKEIP